MTSSNKQNAVAVVLCTFNGEKHIEAQLDSLLSQSHAVDIHVFDDHSTDSTLALLEEFNKANAVLEIHRSKENTGYVKNFETGISTVLERGYGYIALSDQDDIWEPDKIALAVQAAKSLEQKQGLTTPVLVHSDLQMIDANEHLVHHSFLQYRGYEISEHKHLAKILGQNGVMGNTVLMNSALASMAMPVPSGIHVHDYWLAVVAELFGHRVMIDKPLVKYRIHAGNASNSTSSVRFGVEKWLSKKSWRGFVTRDYRLPFKEDTRAGGIDTLLAQDNGLPPLQPEQEYLIRLFKRYLEFTDSRSALFFSMMKHGFFKKGLAHRLRLAYSMLLTKRYSN